MINSYDPMFEEADGKNEKVSKYIMESISFEIPDTGFNPRTTTAIIPA